VQREIVLNIPLTIVGVVDSWKYRGFRDTHVKTLVYALEPDIRCNWALKTSNTP
jgi:hypothetical protein